MFTVTGRVGLDIRQLWSECEAKRDALTFGNNYNAVKYIADIRFDPKEAVAEPEVKQLLAALPITWDQNKSDRGEAGVYSVRIENTNPLRIIVASPCYFVQDAGDGGAIPTNDQKKVTGFVTKPWNE